MTWRTLLIAGAATRLLAEAINTAKKSRTIRIGTALAYKLTSTINTGFACVTRAVWTAFSVLSANTAIAHLIRLAVLV